MESAGLLFPLFDYTYDRITTLVTAEKAVKDPCEDVQIPDGRIPSPSKLTTVLVTGGAGFIGSNLVDRLLELEYKVRILDNLYTGFIRNVPLQDNRVEFYFGDILDKQVLKLALEGVEYVYHLAAMSKVLPSVKSPDMARFCTETNALGSWNVLNASREQGNIKKVVYAASSTYYGNRPAPHQEDMAPDFITPYAASKYEGEIQMKMFDSLFEVPTISTRFFMVYGPRQPSTGAYAIVTGVFAKQASEGKHLTIEGDGSHYRDFIHVADIVDGLILAQQSPDLCGDVVNLGSGTSFSVQDVADLVSSDQVHVDARKNDLEGTLADTCKMKRLLGYRVKKDFTREMAFMAKQTMEGNVFIQPWFTSLHAISALHLLPIGSPLLKRPKDGDIDDFFSRLTNMEMDSTTPQIVTIIQYAILDATNIEVTEDLLLNTIFSLVRFAGQSMYFFVAMDQQALNSCTSLNLPCYNTTSATATLEKLLNDGYDIHFAQLGNSYIKAIVNDWQEIKNQNDGVDTLHADRDGDLFISANIRTIRASQTWIEQSLDIFDPSTWLRLEGPISKLGVQKFCYRKWTGPESLEAAPGVSENVTVSNLTSVCGKQFYVAANCSKNTMETIEGLKAVGAWHLRQCDNRERCDRQQVVPLRWLEKTPDLRTFGGLC